jgi:predicted unusual protein kinase regulating ubiquinone biosynthesis (AarF/ABC1/UbiB family)
MDCMMSDKPPTKAKRFFKLAGMTASVAGGYAKTRVKAAFKSKLDAQRDLRRSYAQAGEQIAQTLGELKGAVMKVGQMASITADILPQELSNALKKLQHQAPPMAYDVIQEQVTKELGSPPERLFASFDTTPFASASIGQVHRARTDDGREVVCKVQYPGVDLAVDSDLNHLKFAFRASGLSKISRSSLNDLFDELRLNLHDELDYCLEADSLRFFHEAYGRSDLPIVIPEVIGEHSSKRVLTMSFESGNSLDQLESYSQDEKNRLGHNLVRMIAHQLFELNHIHADPNPGNFAFQPDGSIIVYDFGCTKKLPRPIIRSYRDAIVHSIDKDYDAFDEDLLRLGVREPNGPPIEHAYYELWREIILHPLLKNEEYDFGTSVIHKHVLEQVPGLLKRLSSFRPPKELVFLDRMVAGHYGNLLTLGAQVKVGSIIEPYLAQTTTAGD